MKTIIRKAEAVWKGNLSEGHGLVSTESGALREEKFSFHKRVDENGETTNPEELIGAALASCFGMALSKTLEDQNVTADTLRAFADVSLAVKDEGPSLNEITLNVEALIADFGEAQLKEAVEETARNCPVFQLLEPGLEKINVSSSMQS